MRNLFQSKPAAYSDEHLMQKICKGERAAFELLYHRYFDKLLWFAGGFIKDRQQAEDIVQEVFLKIINQAYSFDQEKKFSTWVYTITGNMCKNALRNQTNRERIAQEMRIENTDFLKHQLDYHILKERINRMFSELSEKEKSIYNLRLEQEMSIKEIASIMNIPEGSVKSGIYYLLKKLAAGLKEYTYEK